jgi:hypothetical protein
MIAYAELAVLALLLLGGGKKKSPEAEYVSPRGAQVPPGGMKAPPPDPENPSPTPADYSPAAQQPVQPAPGPVAPAPVAAPPGPAQTAAQNMLTVLTTRMSDGSGRGPYRIEDMETYKAFQRAARVTSDGMPGKGTMDRLKGVLSAMGLQLPAGIPIYPWKTSGGFHHPNAPEMREWNPAGIPAPPQGKAAPAPAPQAAAPASPPAAPPGGGAGWNPATQQFEIPATTPTDPVQAAASNMFSALQTRVAESGGHGAYRAADMPIYRAFQTLAKLTPVDGLPGPKTMAALEKSLNAFGATTKGIYPALTVYSFHGFNPKTGGDGKNGPKGADWNAGAALA